MSIQSDLFEEVYKLRAINAELLAALKAFVNESSDLSPALRQARAIIAKIEK